MERAVASHGDAGDGAVGAPRGYAVAFFNQRKKLLEKEILVAAVAVAGVDVEARAAVGRGNEELLELLFVAQVFDEIPEAGVDKELFVVAEAVKIVEDREFFGLVSVERSGENDAIGDRTGENFRREGVAFDAAAGMNRDGHQGKEKNGE